VRLDQSLHCASGLTAAVGPELRFGARRGLKIDYGDRGGRDVVDPRSTSLRRIRGVAEGTGRASKHALQERDGAGQDVDDPRSPSVWHVHGFVEDAGRSVWRASTHRLRERGGLDETVGASRSGRLQHVGMQSVVHVRRVLCSETGKASS
jgi:hypothetical protein